MQFQSSPFVIPLIFSSILAPLLGVIVLRRSSSTMAKALAWLMFSVMIWSLGYTFQLTLVGIQGKIIWMKLQYFGILSIPLAWVAFILSYADRAEWLTVRIFLPLAVPQLTTLGIVWTNPVHHLFYNEISLTIVDRLTVLTKEPGIWHWVHIIYSYLLVISGVVVVLISVIRAGSVYRKQGLFLLTGVSIALGFDILNLLGYQPFAHLDLTPFGFTLSGVAFLFAITRYQLTDLIPVARNTIVEQMAEGMAVVDDRTKILDYNSKFADLLGLEEEQLYGKEVSEILPKWGGRELTSSDPHLSAREMTLERQKGRVIVEISVSQIERGQLILLRNVTARKQMERELEKERHLLRTVIDNIPDSVYVKDRESRFVLANSSLARRSPYESPEELHGLTDFDLHPEGLAEEYYQDEQMILSTGEPVVEKEEDVAGPAGTKQTFLTSKYPLRDAGGNIAGIVGIGRDITDRKLSEQIIRARAAQFERALESLEEPVAIINENGTLAHINERGAELFGLPAESLRGSSVKRLTDEGTFAEILDLLEKESEGFGEIYTVSLQNAGGSTMELNVTAVPLESESGEFLGAFVMLAESHGSDRHGKLARITREFGEALPELLAVCAHCKGVKEEGEWIPPDVYLMKELEVELTHGICPECMQELYPGVFQKKG